MLIAKITDLKGVELAQVKRIPAPQGGNQTKADVTLNGPRTASVRVSVWDEESMFALRARPTTRMLKVYSRPPGQEHAKLVHWGLIARPKVGFGAGVLEVPSVDMTARAKRWFPWLVGYPNMDGSPNIAGGGATVDGAGVEQVWKTMVAPGLGTYPHPSVVWLGGRHGPTHPGGVAMTEGQSFQDFIDALANAADGPDWDLRPLDTSYGAEAPEGISTSAWEELRDNAAPWAFTAQLHTYERKGVDRRQDVSFGYGVGLHNLADLEIEVGGEQQVNAAGVSISGAKENPSAAEELYVFRDIDGPSVEEVGIWGSFQSLSVDPGTAHTNDLAQSTAEAQVDAYKYAPIFVTVTVKKDEEAVHHAFFDFEHGDVVNVQGEAGLALIPFRDDFVKEVPARVTAISLQEDSAGRVQQTLTTLVDIGTDTDAD